MLDTNNDLATLDENGADYQFVDVLQPLGIATLDLMKGVQDDVELGDTMGDCTLRANSGLSRLSYPHTLELLTISA